MIVILTALETEYAAVRAHLADVRPHRHRAGTQFDVGALEGSSACRIALACVGMGNLGAAALTERAIAEFGPSAVMFVGVAGGLRDWIPLGDVVVATRIYAVHGGRSEDEEFLTRPRAWELSHDVEQWARRCARSGEWRCRLPVSDARPEIHFAPIAAGEVVLDSRRSWQADHLRRNYNDALAVEMESAGSAVAGQLNDSTPMVAVRGISDHADGAKDATGGRAWQPVAAANAAAFAVALAESMDTSEESDAPPLQQGVPSVSTRNIAQDNATVSQQIGVNFGANRFGGKG